MIKYLILDVDGTFTDGSIYYDENNNEMKKFCTKDGTGMICAGTAGIELIVLTGRECMATTRRMKELKVHHIYQNIKDKAAWIKNWLEDNGINRDEVGYIGDDINDLESMKLCGFVGCPADAANEVREIADYVSKIEGGHGAVRDVIEKILKDEGIWSRVVNSVYGVGE